MSGGLRDALKGIRDEHSVPSDLEIDRLVTEELNAEQRAALEARAEQDPRLRERIEHARAQMRRFQQTHPPPQWKRPWWHVSRWRPLRVGLAACAVVGVAAGLLLAVPALLVQPPADRLKGELILEVFVNRGGRVLLVDRQTVLHPGDRVQVALTSPRGAYVALLAVDPRGEVLSYLPFDAEQPGWVDGGSRVSLGESAQLDDSVGREVWLTIVCEREIDLAGVRDRLRAWAGQPSLEAADSDHLSWDVADCDTSVLALRKELP